MFSGGLLIHFAPSCSLVWKEAVQVLVIFDACQLWLYDSHPFTISGLLEHSLVPHKKHSSWTGVWTKTVVNWPCSRTASLKNTTGAWILSGIHIRCILKILSLFCVYWKVVHYWEAADSCFTDNRPQASRSILRCPHTRNQIQEGWRKLLIVYWSRSRLCIEGA